MCDQKNNQMHEFAEIVKPGPQEEENERTVILAKWLRWATAAA
jgi:hypothetical protein